MDGWMDGSALPRPLEIFCQGHRFMQNPDNNVDRALDQQCVMQCFLLLRQVNRLTAFSNPIQRLTVASNGISKHVVVLHARNSIMSLNPKVL
jgi:hypothetical protein